MDSNLNSPNLLEMQQQLLEMQSIIASFQQPAQPSAEQLQSEQPTSTTEDQIMVDTLHSLETRPDYSWVPSPILTEVLRLNSSLFQTPVLPDEDRRTMIEKYPGLRGIQYQPPDTIPMAAQKMQKFHTKQDMSLKRLQYLLSAVFRPMDVLGLELSKDTNNGNLQRYLTMLLDCRTLLLNVSSQITEMRNNLALQAINPTFKTSTTSTTTYTMDQTAFQALIVQQTSASQAVRNAGQLRTKKRFNPNQQQSQTSTFQPNQFFRSGPSSLQGGYLNNNNTNSNFRSNNQTSNNKPRGLNSNNSNSFVTNRRWSAQPILYSVDHTFNRRMAAQSHQTGISNSIFISASSPKFTNINPPIQQPTTSIITTRNQHAIEQRSNRISLRSEQSRLLQQYVCHPEEKRWITTSIQPKKPQSIYSCTSLQNGNTTRSDQINKEKQLLNIHRPFRCVFTHPSTHRLSQVPTLPLARYDLPVLHHSVRPFSSPMVIHQTYQADSRMGTISTNSTECVSRRLDYHSRQCTSSDTAHNFSPSEARIIGLACQSPKIQPSTHSTDRTPRLLIGYYNNDSTTSREEVTGSSTQHPATVETPSPITSYNSQSHHAD